jgi:hypothetical protein
MGVGLAVRTPCAPGQDGSAFGMVAGRLSGGASVRYDWSWSEG